MVTIRVYRHELYDLASRSFVRQIHYATEKAIVRKGGVVMYSTAREVEAAQVGADGEWALSPAPFGRRDGQPVQG
jgi:hypothetical protein